MPRCNVLVVCATVMTFTLASGCGSDSSNGDEATGGTGPTGGAAGNAGAAGSSAAGSGGGGGVAGSAGAAGESGLMGATPSDSTEAAIAAYLQAESYKQSPWISQTTAPRMSSSIVSPHGRVRVWLNDTVVASQQAGNGEFGGTAHTAGSMAVKEFYDDADTRVGRAAMLKVPGSAFNWVFYCDSSEQARCGIEEPLPFYGDMDAQGCNGCHGGLVYTQAP